MIWNINKNYAIEHDRLVQNHRLMKITHTLSGKPYHLKPGTRLEVERTNLFFNEWGEQTLPLELPDSDYNLELIGYPDKLANKKKIQPYIPVTIEDGDYFMPCRQAILGVERKSGISTSFYMNEGSFMSKLKDVSLKEIFKDEIIPGINTVKQGIAFCKSLLTVHNDHFACFPVLADFENETRYLNRVEWMDASGEYLYLGNRESGTGRPSSVPSGFSMGFYNEFERVETSNDSTILLSPGYYISPFIKANYLLNRIFAYSGYTLKNNFFTRTDPFSNMVFINNTMDSLVNGTILLAHLVPDCSCSKILNIFRKKFCCEFISDEKNSTVTIQLFNDVISNKASANLSSNFIGNPNINFPTFKQLKLKSESTIENGTSFQSIPEFLSKYPECWFSPIDGAYYHTGYNNWYLTEKVGAATIPYHGKGDLETKEIIIPDCAIGVLLEEEKQIINIESTTGRPSSSKKRFRPQMHLPYIGEANALNSTLVIGATSNDEESEANESAANTHDQNPILCFTYTCDLGFTLGTTTHSSYNGTNLWNYSLHYNGSNGVFERFYRAYDTLLRNSLLPVKVSLLLTSHQKQTMQSHLKIVINGQEFLFDKFNYVIGGVNEPIASELLTTQLYEPISEAINESTYFITPKYKWRIRSKRTIITENEYNSIPIKADKLTYIYPLPPTEQQYNAGGSYYERTYYRKIESQYIKYDVYLEPILYTDSLAVPAQPRSVL